MNDPTKGVASALRACADAAARIRDRLRAGLPVSLTQAFDAVGLDDRERAIVEAIGDGLTFEQAAERIGAASRQRAHQIAAKVARKAGMDRSVFRAVQAVYAAELEASGREAREGGVLTGFTADDVRDNPALQAAARRGRAPLSQAERLSLGLERLGGGVIREGQSRGLSARRLDYYRRRAERFARAIESRQAVA